MTIAFNGILILLIALIAYWWANQGLFSAILHLLCVIAAGAVALSFFEPLTVHVILRGTWFDDYAWGVSLVGLFVVSLLVFRVVSDKLIHANVNVPQWANYAFGLPVGAASAVLALGILFIGAGMTQSHKELMGWEGHGRSHRTGSVEYLGPAIWAPVHRWTNEFYNYLSVGSLYPTFHNTPLARENPQLYRQASLLRDSFELGKGKLSMPPEAVSIQQVLRDPETNRHVVAVDFGALSRDFGEQLTLSASQIRLIATGSNDPRARPAVIHPDAWHQRTPDSRQAMVRFRFDSSSNYVTSMPGGERTSVLLEFAVPRNHTARFIQIRGTRFRLPRAADADAGQIAIVPDEMTVEIGTGPPIDEHVQVSNAITPLQLNKNQPRGTLQLTGDYLSRGEHRFPGRGERAGRALAIPGIYEPPGTRIIQVYMQWDHPHNIFRPEVRRAVADHARLMLVDDSGNAYSPIGYIHQGRQGIEIKLDPERFLPSLRDFPALPDGGTDTLRILFRVTQDVRIRGLMLGDVTMGTCDVQATGGIRR